MRMFVAAYPSEEAVEHLAEFLDVRREAGSFRWTEPHRWHLTLAFLDSVPDRVLDDLTDRVGRAAAKRRPMTATFAGGGAFGHAGRAKVLWVGVETDAPELDRLSRGVRAAAAKAGAPPSGERFVPHLTLARVNPPIEATRWLRVLDSYRGPAWPLERIALVESHLGEGPRHQVVAEFALASP